METTTTKTCNSCGKTLRGRSDKKFCDDYCRNHFNNRRKAEDGAGLRQINNALARNRKILKAFLPPGEKRQRVRRDQLLYHGFQFCYCTQVFTSRKGFVYHFSYEYGCRQLDEDHYLVVRLPRT